jgi:alkanesulfonate monooxygenase SsuD/methylene tetrahydromethanopterin reductase-like flavin-dependent oxidoreductase (luciferase family)
LSVLGFSTIWAPEHVVLLKDYASRYPYSAGDFPMPTETPIADPFITLTYAAACTSRVRLATGVCPVPEHNPVVPAKVIATADVLSGGRLMLGTGIGWLQEEYVAVGVPWERRAHRVREYIEAMRALWAGDVVSYHGESSPRRSGSAARVLPRCAAWPSTAMAGSGSTCCPMRPRPKSSASTN